LAGISPFDPDFGKSGSFSPEGSDEDTRALRKPYRRVGRRFCMADLSGDIDVTLNWQPADELKLVRIDNDASSHALISSSDNSRVRVLPADQQWSVRDVKSRLGEG
jgi:hypothetical protein